MNLQALMILPKTYVEATEEEKLDILGIIYMRKIASRACGQRCPQQAQPPRAPPPQVLGPGSSLSLKSVCVHIFLF
jgi:hypothetical protein